jgi:hypothetical protein
VRSASERDGVRGAEGTASERDEVPGADPRRRRLLPAFLFWDGFAPPTPPLWLERSKTVTDSVCGVWGNMSTGWTRTTR